MREHVHPDGTKIRQLRGRCGLTQQELADKAGYSLRNIQEIEYGRATRLNTLKCIAEVLGVESTELLKRIPLGETDVKSEWNFQKRDSVEGQRQTCNGLRYEVFKVESTSLPGRFARAKRYELNELSSNDRKKAEGYLRRHPEVCYRLRESPYIARHITSAEDTSGFYWWVLDEWIEGKTLMAELRNKVFGHTTLPEVMLGIARGLQALHGEGIIRRELSPCSVFLTPEGGVVLTDFELAKLVEGATVSPDSEWPEDHYRAPEITSTSNTVTIAADAYSWGMILVHCLGGKLPKTLEQRIAVLEDGMLPRSMLRIAKRCVALHPKKRPQTFSGIVRGCVHWNRTGAENHAGRTQRQVVGR